MAVNTKAIKGRIKSVTNTKKITKAMEMVAAAKMRRAVDATLATREYAVTAKGLLDRLSKIEMDKVELLEERPVKKVLAILVSSNRGLCGSFNANLYKKAHQTLSNKEILADDADAELEIDLIGVGKKSAIFAKRYGYNLVQMYDEIGEKPSLENILPITKIMISEFKEKKYDKVVVFYTNFKSSLEQVAEVRQLLPVSSVDIDKMIDEIGEDAKNTKEEKVEEDIDAYEFEPNVKVIIENVLPRLVESQLLQAVLESTASEHSARMVAMKNASENAGELIDELTLSFNKARQAGITQEIAEIAAGAAAL